MKKGVIITLPKFDDVTEYLYSFSKPIIALCKAKNVNVRPIKKEWVKKNVVESAISSYDYNFIIFNGHGDMDSIYGHKNEILIREGENENILKNRMVYARACWASLNLGSSYTKGKTNKSCFIGYNLEFSFLFDKTRTANPSKDKIAKIFFETSNIVPIDIIRGDTAMRANENSKKAMLKMMNRLLSKPDADSQAVAQVLWDNYSGQTFLGNKNYQI